MIEAVAVDWAWADHIGKQAMVPPDECSKAYKQYRGWIAILALREQSYFILTRAQANAIGWASRD